MADVVIIDYGMGNILSVRRGLEHCGATVAVTDNPQEIRAAEKLVLPGVGSFADGMAELRDRGLVEAVAESAGAGTPLLGICLGMQMLLEESEEFGSSEGLGLLAGRVTSVPSTTPSGKSAKIPHIGWSPLQAPSGVCRWDGTILENVDPGDFVYFVHSYMADPADPDQRLADSDYGGIAITAVVESGNVFGCQFHPEKSGEVGLEILRAFLAK